jgi:hypothetical protein
VSFLLDGDVLFGTRLRIRAPMKTFHFVYQRGRRRALVSLPSIVIFISTSTSRKFSFTGAAVCAAPLYFSRYAALDAKVAGCVG